MRLGTRKLSITGLVVVIGTLAMLLSACGSSTSGTQVAPPDKQIFKPLSGGANAGDLDTLDPGAIQFGVDYDKAQMIFPQLITLTDDLKPIDWAAKSHEISSDGKTYTFHLNSGMKWSDGKAIDANTFAYSINRSLDPCFASPVSYYNLNIVGATDYSSKTCDAGTDGLDKTAATALIGKSIVVADPLTLKVTIEAPAAYFLSEMSYPTFWGVPKQLIDQHGQTKWFDHLQDGSGFGGNLYKLTRWQHPTPTSLGSLRFDRNERFWGQKPLLSRIGYTLYHDANRLWQDFAQGAGDVAVSVPSALFASIRAIKGISIQQTRMLSYWFVRLNWDVAPFDDVRVRQAFSLALDRNALLLQGFPSPQANLSPETIRAYRQPTIHLVPEGMPGYNPDLTDAAGRKGADALTPDRDAARALARAYAAERCGGDYAKCPPITIPRPTRSPSSANVVAEAVLDQARRAFPGWVIQLEEIGGVELKVVPPLQVLLDGWGADYPDPQDFLSLLWTTHAPLNYPSESHVSVPLVDALLAQADGMSDQTARLPLYQLAEQLLVNQGAAIPLYQPLQNDAVRSRVRGWHIAPTLQTPLAVWQTAYLTR